MSKVRQRVLKRLEPAAKEPVRRIMVSLPVHTIANVKQIAKAMRQVSGKRITQSMIFNDAIEAFLKDCLADPEVQKMLSAAGYGENFRQPADGKADCGMELPPAAVDQAELEKRLAAYMQSEEFQRDISELAQDYQHQGLPVPPAEQIREEAVGEARKCLESVMACEAKGHLWKEKAGPENGTSDLTCRRCGASDHLQW